MTAKTSRIVIKTFIKTALKDSDESPERCSRNLVDMALNFANGRFQQSFFEISRAMLNNENSPYYPLIEDVLKHMDKEKLIDFGLNIGYNGCTTGAHMIRKLKRTEDINVPWLLSLVIDTSQPDFITKYDSVLKQGKELGIYTYFLYTKDDPAEILPLIQNNPDCAIILLCDPSRITEELAEKSEALNNVLFAVKYDDQAEAACPYSETIVSCTLCIISILRKTVMRSWPALTSVLQKKCTARSPLFSAMWTAPLRPATPSTRK